MYRTLEIMNIAIRDLKRLQPVVQTSGSWSSYLYNSSRDIIFIT